MEGEKNPFEAVRAMMLENLEKVGDATQSYIDMVERTMRGVPGANEEQIGTFKAYIERQVATNRDFGEKLLRAKDFQEAFRIQVEFFQSQLKAAAEEATQIGAKMAGSFNRTTWAAGSRRRPACRRRRVPDRRGPDLLGRILSRGRLIGLRLRALIRLDPICDLHQCSHPIFCLPCLG